MPCKLAAQEKGSSHPNVKVLQSVVGLASARDRVVARGDGVPQPVLSGESQMGADGESLVHLPALPLYISIHPSPAGLNGGSQ